MVDCSKEGVTIVVCNVFQAKVGRAGELVQLMADNMGRAGAAGTAPRRWRVLSDLAGPFDTIVLEAEAPSVAGWERRRAELFTQPALHESFARFAELMTSGRTELYTIEAEGVAVPPQLVLFPPCRRQAHPRKG